MILKSRFLFIAISSHKHNTGLGCAYADTNTIVGLWFKDSFTFGDYRLPREHELDGDRERNTSRAGGAYR